MMHNPWAQFVSEQPKKKSSGASFTIHIFDWATEQSTEKKRSSSSSKVLLLCVQLRWDPWLICHPAFHSLSLSPSPDWLVPSLINYSVWQKVSSTILLKNPPREPQHKKSSTHSKGNQIHQLSFFLSTADVNREP